MGPRRGEDALSYVIHVIVMWFALAHTMTPTTSWAYWRQGDTPIYDIRYDFTGFPANYSV
jgi:hypothetical protein